MPIGENKASLFVNYEARATVRTRDIILEATNCRD